MAVQTTPVPAAGRNALEENYFSPAWDPDPLNVPEATNVHSESKVVYFNNEYLMFHRRLWGLSPGGGERYSIALSTSADGTNFTFQQEVAWPGMTPDMCFSVNAPKVLIHSGTLTMVFESNPWGDGSVAGCAIPKYNQVVGIAHSTDGRNWVRHRTIIRAKQVWEGAALVNKRHAGNVGTPTIMQHAGVTYIGYHGWDGVTAHRGYAYTTSDPRDIGTATNQSTPNLTRVASYTNFVRQDGSTLENRPEFSSGVGAADITTWFDDAPGSGDSLYYMVFEGFRGPIEPCGHPLGHVTLAIARATTPAGPWWVQDNVLYGEHQGVDPVGQCGEDMPSWNHDVNTKQYKVILTEPDRRGLNRIALRFGTAPPPPTTTTAPPPPPPPAPKCSNGNDDDGDGRIDLVDPRPERGGGDPGCVSTSDDDEGDPWRTRMIVGGENLYAQQTFDRINSDNGLYTLLMQCDGNLVVYRWLARPWQAPDGWASNTARQTCTSFEADFGTDGNLAVWLGGELLCHTHTAGPIGHYELWMQDDANLVIYGPNGVVAARHSHPNVLACTP